MKILSLIGILTITSQNPTGIIENKNNIVLQNINQLKKPDTWENFLDNIATIYSWEHRDVRIDKKWSEDSIKNITSLYKDAIINKVGDLVDGFTDVKIKNKVFRRHDLHEQPNPEDFPVAFTGHRASVEIGLENSWHLEGGISTAVKWSFGGNALLMKSKGSVEVKLSISGGYSHSQTETFLSERYIDGNITNLMIPPKKTLRSLFNFYETRGTLLNYALYRVKINPNQYANISFNSRRDGYRSTNVIRVDIGSYILKMVKLNPEFFLEKSGDLFVIDLKTNVNNIALPISQELPLGISTTWHYNYF